MTAQGWVVIGSGAGVGCSLVSESLSSLLGKEGHLRDGMVDDLQWPVILVVGLRAASLDSALLAAREVRARGLAIVGWVGNTVDEHAPWPEENIHTLRLALLRRHGAPCLGIVPWLARPAPATVASYLDHAAIRATVSGMTEPSPSYPVGP